MNEPSTISDPERDSPCLMDDTVMTRVLASRLDREREVLDAPIAARLAAARRHALRSSTPGGWVGPATDQPWLSLSGSGLAVVASGLTIALGVSLWLVRDATELEKQGDVVAELVPVALHDLGRAPISSLEHLPVLSDPDDIDFYRSMEFLLWLEMDRG